MKNKIGIIATAVVLLVVGGEIYLRKADLKRYGMFGAKAAFLLCSSHDAHDNINHQPVVDVNPSFPSHQYKSAYWEIIHRYLLPRILKEEAPSEISKDGKVFNPGFQALVDRFKKEGIPFFIWLHPDRVETENGAYNQEGEEIMAFCRRDSIPLIKGLDVMQLDYYRDGIHVNERGQKVIANNLNDLITDMNK